MCTFTHVSKAHNTVVSVPCFLVILRYHRGSCIRSFLQKIRSEKRERECLSLSCVYSFFSWKGWAASKANWPYSKSSCPYLTLYSYLYDTHKDRNWIIFGFAMMHIDRFSSNKYSGPFLPNTHSSTVFKTSVTRVVVVAFPYALGEIKKILFFWPLWREILSSVSS